MTKHMRLVVSVLFIVIIVLAVAITRFYSSTGKSTELSGTQPAIEKILDDDKSGNHIFQNDSGMYGIIDSNERVIVYPEWNELKFTESGLCIASKRIRGKMLFGGIDYERNISLPFVYSDISRINMPYRTLYAAKSAYDQSVVIYDQNFNPCFSRVWDSYKESENELILRSKNGTYSYSVSSGDMILRNAAVKGEAIGHPFTIEVTNKYLLSQLSISSLENMCRAVERYMKYAFTGDSSLLSDINAAPSAVFLTLFPEDHSITEKNLMGISDISLYSASSDSDLAHYKLSITADISISYKNEEKKLKRLRGDYKSIMEFTYSPNDGLKVISGDFVPNKPSYPATNHVTQPNGQQTTDNSH